MVLWTSHESIIRKKLEGDSSFFSFVFKMSF